MGKRTQFKWCENIQVDLVISKGRWNYRSGSRRGLQAWDIRVWSSVTEAMSWKHFIWWLNVKQQSAEKPGWALFKACIKGKQQLEACPVERNIRKAGKATSVMWRKKNFMKQWVVRGVTGHEEWGGVLGMGNKGNTVLRMSGWAFRQTLLLYTHSQQLSD